MLKNPFNFPAPRSALKNEKELGISCDSGAWQQFHQQNRTGQKGVFHGLQFLRVHIIEIFEITA
jgi:hypothetical protein